MTSPDREVYQSFRHLRVEAAFLNRVYVVYRPTGLTRDKQHKQPEILGQVKVIGFSCDAREGCLMTLEDLTTGAIQQVGFIPKRLFGYDVFVAVPPFSRIRWDARPDNGAIRRSMAFGILIKTRTKSDHYSMGAVMLESPKGFRALYPAAQYDLPLLYV